MRKLFATIAVVSLFLGGTALSQTYEVYNKLGSEGLFSLKTDDWSLSETEDGFGGFYNTAFGLINMPKFSAQAEYRLDFAPDSRYDDYKFVGNPIKANVWFRPARGLELVFGNNFYQALPGSFMSVFNEFSPNGWYGKKYFGITTVWGPLTAGLNVPHLSITDDKLDMDVNFGANLNLNILNVGANYKMDAESFSVFANFTGVKNLYLSAGYTYNGYAVGTENGYVNWRKIFDYPAAPWNDRYTKNHVLNFSGTVRFWRFTLGADVEAALNNADQNPFYAGGVVIFELIDDLDFKVDVKYFTEFLNDDRWRDPWNVTVHPRLIFENERHQIIAGVKMDFHRWLTPAAVDSRSSFALAIPVSWKYKF